MAIRPVTRAGVGLVVGIIILAGLTYAGLWYVRDQGEQARREEAITIAEEQLKKESEQDVAISPDKSASSEQAEGSKTTPPSTQSSSHASNGAELPQTGPDAMSIIVIGLLSFALVSFIRSRKFTYTQL